MRPPHFTASSRVARSGLSLLLTCAALQAPGTAQAAEQAAEEGSARPARPNVLIFLADDLGYGDIGVHGCKDIPTPHIDSIAREGVRCTNGYVVAPRCAPSRCGLLTGRYPQRYGCELDAERGLPPGELTLAQRLKPAGYATGLVGKWHLGKADADHPNARGFDEFFGFLGGVNAYLPRAADEPLARILRGREPARVAEYLTDVLGREAQGFLERHAREPFFLLVAFNAPHGPVAVPEERLGRFAAIAEPARRKYAAAVADLDGAIGGVLAKLRALGLDEETLVLFLSDNGGPARKKRGNGSSNAPLRGEKGSLWEGGVRVPFLARWKGVLPAGRVHEQALGALDVVPTVLGLAGVAAAAPELDGVDVFAQLAGQAAPAHAPLFWRYSFPPRSVKEHKWAIRVGDLKLVHSPWRDETSGEPTGVDFTGLYDVARDPGETVDLARERAETVKDLEQRWKDWNAGMPVPRALARPAGGGEEDAGGDEEEEDD